MLNASKVFEKQMQTKIKDFIKKTILAIFNAVIEYSASIDKNICKKWIMFRWEDILEPYSHEKK